MKIQIVMLERSCYPLSVKDINAAAKALGRLGGLKGGKARAEKLSAERRKEIAKKAAAKRWAKPSSHPPQQIQQDAPKVSVEGHTSS